MHRRAQRRGPCCHRRARKALDADVLAAQAVDRVWAEIGGIELGRLVTRPCAIFVRSQTAGLGLLGMWRLMCSFVEAAFLRRFAHRLH